MSALTEEVIGNLNQEQKDNLKELYHLGEREKDVDGKIQRLFQTGFYSEDGISITPCEDWDDFRVINMFKSPEEQHPLYKQAIEIGGQIKETLKKSLELGLEYLGFIQRQCKNYEVEM